MPSQLQPNELTDRFVGVKFPPSLFATLTELAEQRGVTASAVIRDAVRAQAPTVTANQKDAQPAQ